MQSLLLLCVWRKKAAIYLGETESALSEIIFTAVEIYVRLCRCVSKYSIAISSIKQFSLYGNQVEKLVLYIIIVALPIV